MVDTEYIGNIHRYEFLLVRSNFVLMLKKSAYFQMLALFPSTESRELEVNMSGFDARISLHLQRNHRL